MTELLVVIIIIASLALTASPMMAQITVVNTGSLVSPVSDDPKTAVLSFNAGAAANKLIARLTASWESGIGDISATWNGTENFTLATKPGGGRNSAVLYLDNPTPGTGDIVVTFVARVLSRIGVASLVGSAAGVAVTSIATGRSGSLATPVDKSWVIGVFTSNDLPTISGPFTTTLHNGNSGSSAGNSSYQAVPLAGPRDYTWTVSAPASDNNVLATFVPVNAAPVIVATAPADNAINVPITANLVAIFSELVSAGTDHYVLIDSGLAIDQLFINVEVTGP